MSRQAGLIVVAFVLTALLFASVTTAGGVDLWIEPQWDPAPLDIEPIEIESSSEATPPPIQDDDERSPIEIPQWLQAILQVIVVTIAIVSALAVVTTAWRRRPRLRWRRREAGDGDFEPLPDVAAAVVDEAAAQRAALLAGTPRNAIVQCWLRLESDVAAAGLPRRPADTSAEFTERILGRYTVDAEAIRELAGLYREARFSEHPLDESSRGAALAALTRLHQGLSDFAAESVDAGEVATSTGGM